MRRTDWLITLIIQSELFTGVHDTLGVCSGISFAVFFFTYFSKHHNVLLTYRTPVVGGGLDGVEKVNTLLDKVSGR